VLFSAYENKRTSAESRADAARMAGMLTRWLEDLVESPPRRPGNATPEELADDFLFQTYLFSYYLREVTMRIVCQAEQTGGEPQPLYLELPRPAQSAWDRLLTTHFPKLPLPARLQLLTAVTFMNGLSGGKRVTVAAAPELIELVRSGDLMLSIGRGMKVCHAQSIYALLKLYGAAYGGTFGPLFASAAAERRLTLLTLYYMLVVYSPDKRALDAGKTFGVSVYDLTLLRAVFFSLSNLGMYVSGSALSLILQSPYCEPSFPFSKHIQTVRGVLTMADARPAGTRDGPVHSAAFLQNTVIPALVCLEPPAGRGGGADTTAALSSEALAARRRLCTSVLLKSTSRFAQKPLSYIAFVKDMDAAFGAAMGKTLAEIFGEVLDPSPLNVVPETDVPFEVTLFYTCLAQGSGTVDTEKGGCIRAAEWILSDPYLGPVFRRRACKASGCGLLPSSADKLFQACSLCKDASAGRFCSKEPCFAAFWKGGHKKECAGKKKA
jgi:hypothetical protein